jgi:hypothetical protein
MTTRTPALAGYQIVNVKEAAADQIFGQTLTRTGDRLRAVPEREEAITLLLLPANLGQKGCGVREMRPELAYHCEASEYVVVTRCFDKAELCRRARGRLPSL